MVDFPASHVSFRRGTNQDFPETPGKFSYKGPTWGSSYFTSDATSTNKSIWMLGKGIDKSQVTGSWWEEDPASFWDGHFSGAFAV